MGEPPPLGWDFRAQVRHRSPTNMRRSCSSYMESAGQRSGDTWQERSRVSGADLGRPWAGPTWVADLGVADPGNDQREGMISAKLVAGAPTRRLLGLGARTTEWKTRTAAGPAVLVSAITDSSRLPAPLLAFLLCWFPGRFFGGLLFRGLLGRFLLGRFGGRFFLGGRLFRRCLLSRRRCLLFGRWFLWAAAGRSCGLGFGWRRRNGTSG